LNNNLFLTGSLISQIALTDENRERPSWGAVNDFLDVSESSALESIRGFSMRLLFAVACEADIWFTAYGRLLVLTLRGLT
jgi:hypothetical protein